MYLVGATRIYITRPFIIRATLQGMLAGGLGMLMFSFVYILILQRFPEISELSDIKEVAFLMGITFLFSVILTSAGTFLSAFRLVNLKSAELYQ
jgi:cell division transport system permease protein